MPPRSASPSSTTTARCGARSRCHPARLHPPPAGRAGRGRSVAARTTAVQGRATSADLQWLGGAMTKHYQGDDTDLKLLGAAHSFGQQCDHRRGPRAPGQRLLRRRPAPDAATARTPHAATCRWSSCCATWRPTASPATSSRAAAATSCARSRRRIYGIPPERVIGSSVGLDFSATGNRLHHLAAGLLRRRPSQAGADLEPHRPAADLRRRQLQRRHRDAAVRRRPGRSRRCDCWCSTTTPSASSTTPPARSALSSFPGKKGGRWPVFAATGPWSSPTEN